MLRSRVFAAVALVLTALRANAADVIRVGPSGFPTLQAAFSAASNGDVLLIAPGTYAGGALTGKGLVIVADGAVTLTGGLSASSLPLGSVLVLDGLTISGVIFGPSLNTPALSIVDANHLRVQSCTLRAMAAVFPTAGAVRLERVEDAAIQGTQISSQAASALQLGRIGILTVFDVALVVESSIVFGGAGGDGPSVDGIHFPGQQGGPAISSTTTSRLFVSRSQLEGGPGGVGAGTTGCSNPPSDGGAGGAGLETLGSSSTSLLDSVVVGGTGGFAGPSPVACLGQNGANGAPFVGNLPTTHADSARSLECAGVVREGASLSVRVRGSVGDHAWLAVSQHPDQLEVPGQIGVRLIGSPAFRIDLGALDATGSLDTVLYVRSLPMAVDARVWHTQLVVEDASGNTHLGSARVITVLDASF